MNWHCPRANYRNRARSANGHAHRPLSSVPGEDEVPSREGAKTPAILGRRSAPISLPAGAGSLPAWTGGDRGTPRGTSRRAGAAEFSGSGNGVAETQIFPDFPGHSELGAEHLARWRRRGWCFPCAIGLSETPASLSAERRMARLATDCSPVLGPFPTATVKKKKIKTVFRAKQAVTEAGERVPTHRPRLLLCLVYKSGKTRLAVEHGGKRRVGQPRPMIFNRGPGALGSLCRPCLTRDAVLAEGKPGLAMSALVQCRLHLLQWPRKLEPHNGGGRIFRGWAV